MALTNAEKQRRWRDQRNYLASAFQSTPKVHPDMILHELGPDRARKILKGAGEAVT
jgi:hypothetical protein